MRIGVLTSVGQTLDAFFPRITATWEGLGHQVFVAAGDSANMYDTTVLSKVSRRPSAKNIGAPQQIREWASLNGLDVIVTNTAVASTLARIRPGGVPVVYFCHGLHWNTGKRPTERVWMAVEKALLRNTHAVMCMNSDDRTWFQGYIDPKRLLYLTNGVGVPMDQFEYTPLPKRTAFHLLWAGEFSDRKRPELAVQVANRLRSKGVDFQLTMLGKGRHLHSVQQQIADLGLQDSISTLGHLPIQDHIKNCHVVLHTATWEGLPRVLLEARAMGRASVAFDVKGVRDIPDVVLAPDGDVDALVSRLIGIHSMYVLENRSLPPAEWELDSTVVAGSIAAFLDTVVSLNVS